MEWEISELKVTGPLVSEAREPYPFTGKPLIFPNSRERKPTEAQIRQIEIRVRNMRKELSLQD